MSKKQSTGKTRYQSIQQLEPAIAALASEQNLELVEVALRKESRGKCLSIYLDKEGGITLDDCEAYHRRVQPMLEDVDYDVLEVSSPGVDRPVKNQRDFEKNQGRQVEVRLFAPLAGSKIYQGSLEAMDEDTITIRMEQGEDMRFERKAVALVKPIVTLDID